MQRERKCCANQTPFFVPDLTHILILRAQKIQTSFTVASMGTQGSVQPLKIKELALIWLEKSWAVLCSKSRSP